MLIKYGIKRAYTGSYDPYPFQCPNCKELDSTLFYPYSDYWHCWYIPIFPYEKDGHSKCDRCGFTVQSIKFNRNTRDIYREQKRKFRHPFYTYIGAAILGFPFAVGLIIWLSSVIKRLS